MSAVAIIMGSDSDLEKMQGAIDQLDQLKISYDIKIVSAHRTPEMMQNFAKSAHKKGYKVIIAGAGGAAHLPGMVASFTTLPVIGVPITVGKLKGLDALLSIAQMPKGVPVATMAIDNSTNAGLLAARILGINSKKVHSKLETYQKELRAKVRKMNSGLNNKLKSLIDLL